MCGIAGIYRSKPEADDRKLVQAMLDQLRSRGPDGEGIVSQGLLCLGHRRLAVLDLSDAARQPMVSASGRYLISFNGEIYNYRDLINDLGIAPESLRTRGDTEVLLRAWERWGSDCLNRLAGQWAFALYDRQEERLWLVRDRFGEKPLYYHEKDGILTFSSTIMGLLKAPRISREIQPEALVECLTMRYVVSPRTIVQGISKIPPGHLLTAAPSGREIRSWWTPRFRPDCTPFRPGWKERTAEEFGELLGQACRRCLVSDRPAALLLSNGIDSGALAVVLSDIQPSFRAFTYEVGNSRDGPIPANGGPGQGAALRGEMIRVTYDEVASNAVRVLSGLNEPVGDGSALAVWLLIRKACPEATVFLCGQGGDEVLAGYRLSQDRFRLAALRLFCKLPLPALDRAMPYFVNGMEPDSVRRRNLARSSASLAPAAARFLIHRPLPAWALQSLMGTSSVPDGYLSTVDWLYRECASGDSDLDRIQEVMLRTFLAENLLSVGDSVAMASSAELRMPYLDRDLVEFVFGLPREMRLGLWPGRANTKLLLRRWGRNRLPHKVLHHPKRGFRYGSIRALLKSPASDLRSLILDSGVLRRHVRGLSTWMAEPPGLPRGTWGATTWTLASLAAWCQATGVS